jgi:pyruvate/2-oxoglutarate dehydrogenase complex dihydrolipoamide dehydrogenase (E3) component
VTVVERSAHLLSREDPEMADALQAVLMAEGVEVHTSTTAAQVFKSGDVKVVECMGGLRLEADAILLAVGRRPNMAGLGLEAAGISYDAKGIEVDRRLRTSQKNIYACGDVCGPFPFTHMAEYQAGIIISNAVFRFPKKTDYRVVPWVMFTDPELARVGLTEQQAREQGIAPEVLRFPFVQNDRALTEVEAHGMVKLVARKGKLLGASILGPHAGELIHEMALAMKTGASLGDISATIHAYPTLAQANRRAVNTGFAKTLFSPATRRLVKWIERWLPW